MVMETQTGSSILVLLPEQIECFMDQLKVIRHYKGCKLNSNHSKLDSYELGVVLAYINGGRNLNKVHNSLVDAKAQSDVFLHHDFIPYVNKKESIQPIDEIFARTMVR